MNLAYFHCPGLGQYSRRACGFSPGPRRARNTERGEPKLSAKVGQRRKDEERGRGKGKGSGHDSRKKPEPLAGAYTRWEPEASGVTVPLRPIRREDGRKRRRGRPKSMQIIPSQTERDAARWIRTTRGSPVS